MQYPINKTGSDTQLPPEGGASVEKIAALVSIACVLQISEALIPQPVPGVRVGLANMITMLTLLELGFKSALEVAVLRTVVSSFVLGTFMTPTFIMSFSGAVVSTMAMGIFTKISSFAPKYGFSIIGISVIGSIVHNITQLTIAYFLLVKHPSIFYFLPILMVSAVIMGWVTGFITIQVWQKLLASKQDEKSDNLFVPAQSTQAVQYGGEALMGNSFLHRLAPEWKILGMIVLCGLIVFLRSFWMYLILASAFTSLMLVTRLPWSAYGKTLSRMRSLGSFILISFSFPIIFSATGSGPAIASFGPLKISEQGLATGSLFAVRIIMLLWVSHLLSVYTAPASINAGLKKVLWSFKFLGLPVNRISSIISIAWSGLPSFREKVRATICERENILAASGAKRTGLTRIKNLINIISDIITAAYSTSVPPLGVPATPSGTDALQRNTDNPAKRDQQYQNASARGGSAFGGKAELLYYRQGEYPMVQSVNLTLENRARGIILDNKISEG